YADIQKYDGVKVSVNGTEIINQSTGNSTQEFSGTISLTANQKVDIRIDYYDNTGNARMKLSWSSPSRSKQIIPTTRLYPAP
ncbi:MAG: PA14 domain-containing protein, partial [Chloroflexota bacterium]